MKKLLGIVVLGLLLGSNVYAGPNDKVRDGFISKKRVHPVKNDFNIDDPKNKIIVIYNHGQNKNDFVSGCSWVSMLRNHASLIDQEVNGKKIMVYNLCSDHLRGDMSQEKNWWNKKPPKVYKGKHMLDKRVELNLEITEKLVKAGVPRKQVFVTGHSCGGLTTLLLMSRHPDKVGGGISYMQACFGKLSHKYKVKKLGVEKAMEKFRKKAQGPHDLRQKMNDEIKNNLKTPLLAFTHPKDKYEGLLSDWMDDMELIDRVIISENFKINGKSCKKKHTSETQSVKKGHDMDQGLCFQFYNPKILNYISSRI